MKKGWIFAIAIAILLSSCSGAETASMPTPRPATPTRLPSPTQTQEATATVTETTIPSSTHTATSTPTVTAEAALWQVEEYFDGAFGGTWINYGFDPAAPSALSIEAKREIITTLLRVADRPVINSADPRALEAFGNAVLAEFNSGGEMDFSDPLSGGPITVFPTYSELWFAYDNHILPAAIAFDVTGHLIRAYLLNNASYPVILVVNSSDDDILDAYQYTQVREPLVGSGDLISTDEAVISRVYQALLDIRDGVYTGPQVITDPTLFSNYLSP
jgi:hypothetical protein